MNPRNNSPVRSIYETNERTLKACKGKFRLVDIVVDNKFL